MTREMKHFKKKPHDNSMYIFLWWNRSSSDILEVFQLDFKHILIYIFNDRDEIGSSTENKYYIKTPITLFSDKWNILIIYVKNVNNNNNNNCRCDENEMKGSEFAVKFYHMKNFHSHHHHHHHHLIGFIGLKYKQSRGEWG